MPSKNIKIYKSCSTEYNEEYFIAKTLKVIEHSLTSSCKFGNLKVFKLQILLSKNVFKWF